MPVKSSVYLEMARSDEFATAIARARTAQQECVIDETVDMADAATVEDREVVKLRIWARQWRAAKLAPNKYGERTAVDHGNQDGKPFVIQASALDERL